MFCPKCGNSLEDTAAFCDRCGAKTGSTQTSIEVQPINSHVQPQGTAKNNSKFKLWMIPVIFVVVSSVLVVAIPIINSKLNQSKMRLSVEDVKSSHLEVEWGYDTPEFQEQTIGEAFENYFFNTSWDSFELESVESNDKVYIVEFKGNFYYPVYAESPYGGPETKYITTATVQFVSDSNNDEGEFSISSIRLKVVDDSADEWLKKDYSLNNDYLYRFLYAIYDNGWFQCWIYGDE